ncbi:MAG: PASTA domain-containing protein [Coriobacteriia bacterium]|nr:PASTA domain-containing protein [Coriobacteriia bacterium]
MPEYTHTIPSGSRIIVVVSTGPLDVDRRAQLEDDNLRMLDVMGKSQGVALEELAELGLKPRVIYDYNDAITKGAVMDQHPAPDSLTSPDLESLLLVSSGPSINERVQVNLPDVVGLKEESAAAKLRDAGLSPQIVHYKSSSVEKGLVSAQIPDTASLVAQPEVKSKVTWVVIGVIIAALLALGYVVYERMDVTPPPPVEHVVSQVVVPNLIGLNEGEAEVELQKAGLVLGQVSTALAEDTPEGAYPGTVIQTIPANGEEILEGSPVSIVLAADLSAIADDVVVVPDVEGLAETEVEEAFEGLDLDLSIVRAPDLEVSEDYVIVQSPIADTEVPAGSIIVVVISTGEPVDDPVIIDVEDVVGKPVSEATEALQDLGLVVTIPLVQGTAAGTVTGQIPQAGTEVLVGSVVILQVQTGTYE